MASTLQSARDASCTAIRESMIGSGWLCFRRLQTRLALVQTALWSARRRNMHQAEADSCFEAAVRVAKEAGKVRYSSKSVHLFPSPLLVARCAGQCHWDACGRTVVPHRLMFIIDLPIASYVVHVSWHVM